MNRHQQVVTPSAGACVTRRGESKHGALAGPEVIGTKTYLLDRSSLPSGGRTTKRPSTGNAISSMLKPKPFLCGKAAPILVRRLPVLPLLSYSSPFAVEQYAEQLLLPVTAPKSRVSAVKRQATFAAVRRLPAAP